MNGQSKSELNSKVNSKSNSTGGDEQIIKISEKDNNENYKNGFDVLDKIASFELMDIDDDIKNENIKLNRTNDNEEVLKPLSRRIVSVVHPSSDAPICSTCEQLDIAFFNFDCPRCSENLSSPETTIAQIFGIIRQWIPQTQQNIELLVSEILRRGAHVDDRDGLTDMTMLHYACKAGSSGVGHVQTAVRTVKLLVQTYNADVSIRCRWTDMSAIHYAVYFDVAPVLEYLLDVTNKAHIDDICRDFDGGTPLHIAAANLCLQSTKVLLNYAANVLLKDHLSRTPLDCVPDLDVTSDIISDSALDTTREMKKLLEIATLACIPGEQSIHNNQGPVTGKVVLQALGLNLGDRVIISNTKVGTLRYCGATQFASSIWAGVELDQPDGKNDGTVAGVTYFRCPPNHGIFAPINKISKFEETNAKYIKGTNSFTFRNVNFPKVNVSHITPKVETGLSSLKSKTLNSLEISIGNRVMLIDKRIGIVRFIGETKFAPGIWYGIELSKPIGKNNGSVNGVRYFECKPLYGIFAPASRILKKMPERKRLDFDNSTTEDTSSEFSYTLSRSSTDNYDTGKNLSSLSSTYGSPYSSPMRSSSKLNNKQSQLKSQLSSNLLPHPKDTWLTVGVNVFINNCIGVVRYIGTVDFADGTWLGIELRTPTGKNDGSVNGKKYFHCKSNHGILVRPKKVSVRGINGAKLLPDSNNRNSNQHTTNQNFKSK